MSGIKQVFQSVLAAFFGVQSNKNRKKDFTEGKLIHFIIVGVFLVFVFIGALVLTVQLVLSNN
jgi:hypothetical protein